MAKRKSAWREWTQYDPNGGRLPLPPGSLDEKVYNAQREQQQLALKSMYVNPPEEHNSLLDKAGDFVKWGMNTPIGKAVNWLGTQISRPINALEGGLEESFNARKAAGFNANGWDVLKAGLEGMGKGFTLENEYSLGRYLSNQGKNYDAKGNETGRNWLGEIVDWAPFAGAKQFRDINETGIQNATIGDALDVILNFRGGDNLVPKIGKVRVPGKEVYEAGKTVKNLPRTAAKAAGVTDDFIDISPQLPQGPKSGGLSLLDEQGIAPYSGVSRGTPKSATDDLADFWTTSETNLRKTPESVQSVLQWMGLTPFKQQQLAMGAKASEGWNNLMRTSPGIENFLSHFTNRAGHDGSQFLAQTVDTVKMGRDASRRNFSNTMGEFLSSAGVDMNKLSNIQREAMYWASVSGKRMDDPEFLQIMRDIGKIDPDELGDLQQLQNVVDWAQGEMKNFAAKGAERGFFNPLEESYMPIFTKKNPRSKITDDILRRTEQEFGGLRSFQKQRLSDPRNLAKFMTNHADRLDTTDFFDAIDRYSKGFSGLEMRHNLLGELEKLGLVVKGKRPAGYEDLASILMPGTQGGVKRNQYFIRQDALPRLNDQLFGYANGAARNNGFMQTLRKFNELWSGTVTVLNPKFHLRNALDDTTRNIGFSGTNADDYARAIGMGVSRGTDDLLRGIDVQDWTKNARSQWEYTPGAKAKMNLSDQDINSLADAMGVSHTILSDIYGPKKGFVAGARKFSDDLSSTQRRANFAGQLRQLGSNTAAKQMVDEIMLNYRDLSPFMRDVVKPFAPFATFAVKNPGSALNQLSRQPQRMAQFKALQTGLAGGEENLENLPEYQRNKPVLTWKNGDGTSTVFDTGLSQMDIPLDPGSFIDTYLNRMPGPLAQLIKGGTTGVDTFGNKIQGVKEADLIDGILFGEKGADGKQYVDANTKFMLDTILGGLNTTAGNVGQMFQGQPLAPVNMTRTYDDKELLLRALLGQNDILEDSLNRRRDMGYPIPTWGQINPNRRSKGWNW